MKQRIEVRSQAEFDVCVKAGNIAIVIGCSVVAWGNSSVEARENSSVEAWGNSSVVAWGNSSVVAWGNSSVEAWGNSSVEARENSSVVAWGNVIIRLFSCLSIKASAYVTILRHEESGTIDGGRVLEAAPEPVLGVAWCDWYGIDREKCGFIVQDIDASILKQIESKPASFDMSKWHGDDGCDSENWCKTTHCRAGYAICLAGKEGFDLERKYGAETAGRMIYAASRPDKPLPDFFADNEEALADIRGNAEQVGASHE